MHISRFKNDTMDLNRSLNMNKMVWWAIKETFQVFTGFLQSWTSLSPCFLLLVDSIQKQNKKFPSSFFPSLPVHCYFNHNTQACLCGSSFHSTVKEQTKKKKKNLNFFPFFEMQLCFPTEKFLSRGLFRAVVMVTVEACTIFSAWKQDNNQSLTSFLTALFIAAIRAVVLAIASPWQPDTASSSTAELVGRAHGRGCRRRT